MKVVVQDANILIDLEMAEVLELWFQLGHETHTTDQITRQLVAGNHKRALSYIRKKRVVERRFSFQELVRIESLHSECGPGPDFNDCSVLFLALELQACVLTGDKSLRDVSEAKGLEVHGTLWVLDQLIDAGLLAAAAAADALEALLDNGRYLPKAACESRLKAWRRPAG